MKYKVFPCVVFLVTCTLFMGSSCKKDNSPADQLPPATQTGANTFGCLVNGKVFVPKGFDGTGTPNPHVLYDYDLNGEPFLSIEANSFESNSSGGVMLVYRNLRGLGYYSVDSVLKFTAGWPSQIGNCGGQSLDNNTGKWGGGVITKLDITNHIISGKFDFKFKAPNCDTVYITNGRFDIKF